MRLTALLRWSLSKLFQTTRSWYNVCSSLPCHCIRLRSAGDLLNLNCLRILIALVRCLWPRSMYSKSRYAFTELWWTNVSSLCKVYFSGGIPALIKLLDNGSPQVEQNACGALRNLCYGSRNDANKIEAKNHEGVPAVIRLIRSTKNIDTKEQATGECSKNYCFVRYQTYRCSIMSPSKDILFLNLVLVNLTTTWVWK